jgi:alpha-galactosidase
LRGELLIEFRQDYVSPRLWQYGTMIRAGDCPMDATENRVRTIDTRLLSGTRAVHADMLMWHPDASAAEVAAQFIAVLFSTIQISMTLSALSENHRRVLKFWLDFSITHRETLLHGRLLPSHPEARYSQVTAYRGGTTIIVAYVESLVTVDDPFPTELVLVNGCGHAGLVLKTPSRGRVSVEMFGPDGTRVSQTETVLNGAPVIVDVPVSGVAFIRCAN